MRPRLAFAAIAVLGAVLSTSATAVAGTGEAEPPDSTPVLVTDLSGPVAAGLGIGVEEARSRLASQAGAGAASGMAELAGPAYAGEFLDDDGALVVAVTSKEAADAVEAAGATVRLVGRSWSVLTGIRDSLDKHAGVPGTAWGIDPRTNQVVVTIAADATGTGGLLADAASFGDAVTVEHVDGTLRQHADILGGLPIDSTNGVGCSAGFNVTGQFPTVAPLVLTAGHCTRGTTSWIGLGPTVGTTFNPPGPTADFGVIGNSGGLRALPGVYLWNNTYVQVTRHGRATVGMASCHSGRTTGPRYGGALCGGVTSVGATVTYGDGTTVRDMDTTNFCSLPGDSGGPHFAAAAPFAALGVLSGGTSVNGQCPAQPFSVLQPFDGVLQSPATTSGLRVYNGNGGGPVGQSVPATMQPGQNYAVSVTMSNTGVSHWLTGYHRLGTQDTSWGIDRVNLPAQTAPGGQVTFSFTVRAPSTPGSYPFRWRMIEEGVGFFGAETSLTVAVGNPASPVQGQVDSVDRYGVVSGWARDPGAPNAAITVRLSVDGQLVATVPADRDHPTAGAHGFRHILPRRYLDGQQHSVTAVGVDATGDPDAQLGQAVPLRQQRPATRADFDGDHRSDLSTWRDGDGTWYWIGSATGSPASVGWGQPGDRPAPGDYDGDGVTDLAVYRPSTHDWWVRQSGDGQHWAVNFGLESDELVPRDYDGDGRTDVAVWRPSDGTWHILGSTSGYQVHQWGLQGDRPVPGDYDGDGLADLAVWRPSDGVWYVFRSGDGGVTYRQWGQAGDRPAPADYDGDGRTDPAVQRPSDNAWWITRSFDGPPYTVTWGLPDDLLVPGDYDADTDEGGDDVAVWRPSTHDWWRHPADVLGSFGSSTDLPVARAYLP